MIVHSESIRKFKDCPMHVPDQLLSEEQAKTNHGQSLKRLNERGGMGILEILDNIHRRRLTYRNETAEDLKELLKIIENYNHSNLIK